jgi:hypothetical protein
MNGRTERMAEIARLAAAAGAAEIPAEATSAEHVGRRVDEACCALIGCAEHAAALAAEGLTEGEVRWLRAMVDALRDAEALFAAAAAEPQGEKTRRLAAAREVLYAAVGDATGRIRARAAFAFRHDATDSRRRIFFSSYAPRGSWAKGGRRSMCETVELKLR